MVSKKMQKIEAKGLCKKVRNIGRKLAYFIRSHLYSIISICGLIMILFLMLNHLHLHNKENREMFATLKRDIKILQDKPKITEIKRPLREQLNMSEKEINSLKTQ